METPPPAETAGTAPAQERPPKPAVRTVLRTKGERIATGAAAARAAAAIADADSPNRNTPRSVPRRPSCPATRRNRGRANGTRRRRIHGPGGNRGRNSSGPAGRVPGQVSRRSAAAVNTPPPGRHPCRRRCRPRKNWTPSISTCRPSRAYTRNQSTIRRRTPCRTRLRTPRRTGRFPPSDSRPTDTFQRRRCRPCRMIPSACRKRLTWKTPPSRVRSLRPCWTRMKTATSRR